MCVQGKPTQTTLIWIKTTKRRNATGHESGAHKECPYDLLCGPPVHSAVCARLVRLAPDSPLISLRKTLIERGSNYPQPE